MKKTLFLTAILGAALCCSVFAAEYTVTVNSDTEIMFNNGSNQHLSASQAGDIITLNVTLPTSDKGGYFENVGEGGTATIAANLVINSLEFNNGYSRNTGLTYKFTGDISGSGNFTRGSRQKGNNFVFTGDLSQYTGAITFNTTDNATPVNSLTFDASAREGGMTVGATSITMQNGAKLGTVGNVTFKGTITSSNTSIGAGVTTLASGATANLDTLTWAEGATLSVSDGSTLNFTSATEVIESSVESGNGFNSYHYTRNLDANVTLQSGSAIQLKGLESTVEGGVITSSSINDYIVNETSATLDSEILAKATQVHVQQADTALTVTGGSIAYENIVFASGAGLSSLAIDNGGSVSVVGDNNNAGFTAGTVSVGAGSSLVLQGHDALGYNNGEGKGSATPLIEMQGAEGNKAVLDNQDTSGGNPANLTFTTDLTLKGHTEVKGNNIKVFGAKVTATGTDNTIATNLVLDKAMTVEVTGSGDTLTISGNVSGGNAMTKTGEGALTISGAIANNVQLDNAGAAGSMVLDSVTLNGRLNIYNSTGTTMAGGVTSNVAADNYALVVGTTTQGTSSTVTLTEGTYNLGSAHVGIGTYGTLVVDKDASLTAKDISNSGNLANNGALTIKAEDESKGSVTASGTVNLTTLNNEGEATFNGAYNGTNVTLKDGSSTAFNGATSITNLAITGDADLTIGGTATVATGAQVALNTLTMKGGSTLTIGSSSHEDSVVTVKALNVDGDSTLNANLVIAEGSAVDMKGSVTLGCTVTIGAGTVLDVTGDVLAGPVTIFTDVEGLTLGTTEIAEMGWYDANGILASINGTAITGDGQFVIGFWDGTVSVAEASVPEPATATLSLLALAALAARRKRK